MGNCWDISVRDLIYMPGNRAGTKIAGWVLRAQIDEELDDLFYGLAVHVEDEE